MRRTYVDVTTLDQLREAYVTRFEVAGRPVIVEKLALLVSLIPRLILHVETDSAAGCQ